MGRILAIDYGLRRCGLAVTDPLALSINTRPHCTPAELLKKVEEIFLDDLSTVVLTRSSHHDGTPNAIQRDIDRFAERLRKKYPGLQLVFQDEFASSREARDLLRQQGVGKKKRSAKGALDSVSAGIILERYLLDEGIW